MSFLDKLKFWQKDDFALDDGLDDSFGDNLALDRSADNMTKPSTDNNSMNNMPKLGSSNNNLEEKPDYGPSENNDGISSPTSFQKQSQFQQNQSSSNQGDSQLELISSKLDTIKAELDSMNQRIKKIEQIAEQESTDQKKRDPVW